MTVNRTTLLDLPLPVTGTESNTWGDITNNGLTEYMDIAIAGMSNLTSANFTAGALTIETTEGNAAGTSISATSAQYAGFRVTSLAANSTITVGNTGTSPARSYRLINADSTYNLTFKATGQTGVTLLPGQSAIVAFNGTDYVIVGTVGAGTATDNAIARFDGTTGEILQNSAATIDDTGAATFVGSVNVSGTSASGADLKLYEDTDNGTNYVAFKSPASVASNVTWTLPSADGTNGQALTTNGSGTLAFSSVTTSPGGSTTQVQYNNAGAFAGSANFTFDGTNVGIGVTPNGGWGASKAIQFENGGSIWAWTGGIYGTNIASNVYVDSATTAKYLLSSVAASRYQQSGGAHAWYSAASGTAGNAITFTQAMTLDASGNLGIGTSSISNKLEVNGSARFYTAAQGDISITHSGLISSITAAGSVGLALGTNNAERMRIDSAGNVGIGVAPNSAWGATRPIQLENGGSLWAWTGGLYGTNIASNVYVNSSTTPLYLLSSVAASQYQQLSGAHKWYSAPSGTADNAITWTQLLAVEKDKSLALQGATSQSGTGITFPATQSASSDANTLDDYEEGTWSLTVTAGSGSFTSITSTAGYYTKVGNLVSAYGRIKIGTNGTAATDVRVSGLPFSSASGNTRYAGSGLEGDQVGFSLNAFILQSTNLIYLQKYDGTYPGGTSYGLDFTITYRT